MCGFQKVLRKEKNVRENSFFMFGFNMKIRKKESNIIKINKKFIHFKII